MAINKFETGKYYKYNGNIKGSGWDRNKIMEKVLDHNPRLCIVASGYYAMLEGLEYPDQPYWSWSGCLNNFDEVKNPNVLIQEEFDI